MKRYEKASSDSMRLSELRLCRVKRAARLGHIDYISDRKV